MIGIFAAALAYTLLVFALGFVLGTLRVLVLIPRIGETPAIFLELPVMLTASFFLARWTARRWQVPAALAPRILVGVLAFALLMICEIVVSLTLFGNSLAGHFAGYTQPRAWPGLAGQLVFAAMPALLLLPARAAILSAAARLSRSGTTSLRRAAVDPFSWRRPCGGMRPGTPHGA